MRSCLLLICFFLGGTFSFANDQDLKTHVCGEDTLRGEHFSYCIDRDPHSRNLDILYYLHGRGEDAFSWAGEAHRPFREKIAQLGVEMPTVISVSFGTGWLLTDLRKHELPSRYDVFVRAVMPKVETLVPGPHGRRLLLGASMGGYNAALLVTKNGELFSRVALVCPALLTVSPFAGGADVESFISTHAGNVKPEAVRAVVQYARSQFVDVNEWEQNDPLRLTDRLSAQSPPIYVSCGDKDDFGFFDGAREFADRARAAGVAVTWVPLSGGHCVTDVPSLVEFFTTANGLASETLAALDVKRPATSRRRR